MGMTVSRKRRARSRFLLSCLLAFALLMACQRAAPPARGQAESKEVHTGPIDPAAGEWVVYRGERALPGQPAPELYALRVEYAFPPDVSQYGKVVEATVTETDGLGKTLSVQKFTVQTVDRLCRGEDGTEAGYWTYWLTPGLGIGDAASVGKEETLTADEVQDFDFKGNSFRVVRMKGSGVEMLAEERTGLVFRIARDGGESLRIEDTNMLAHCSTRKYCPGVTEVGRRLEALAAEHPDLAELSSLGESAAGRDIWLAHVTDFTSSEEKRSVIIAAAMEGDAPEGCAFLLEFLEEMVEEAGQGGPAAAVLERLNLYAVPMLNPDGVQRWLAMPDPGESVELASQAPRNGNLVCIDRNFDFKWEEGDRDPVSANYAGPTAFSETESQAMRGLFEEVAADLYLNLHAGPDLINAPWNWNESPAANPEIAFYESMAQELAQVFPFPVRVGTPLPPRTGSSLDWAYVGENGYSPACFDVYLHRARGGDEGENGGEVGALAEYAAQREAIRLLVENLHAYLAVDIETPRLEVELNVPIDVEVEVRVSGKRALPDARARLVLPADSGLKFSSMAQKEVLLGDLQPGSSTVVAWSLEGRARGSSRVEFVLTAAYPEYENIPGRYVAEVEITISTQRTWLVASLLSATVLLVLALIFFSMRKQRKMSDASDGAGS